MRSSYTREPIKTLTHISKTMVLNHSRNKSSEESSESVSHLPVFQDHIPSTKDDTSHRGASDTIPPFIHVGIDFLGPLFIKNEFQEAEKAYVCLFTRCATRAVHLELTRSMATESVLLAFTRMMLRQG